MPKPDPVLLDPARYPFRCTIETRFADLDVNMHVNNVALVGILEDARVRFHHASGYSDAIAALTAMVASLAVEYLGQSFFPQPLEIGVAPAQLGRTSYTVHQLVTQEGRTVAYARSIMVCMGQDGPTPIPDAFRASVQPWLLDA